MRKIDLIKTACGGCLEVADMQRLQGADPEINRKSGEITGYILAEQKKARKTAQIKVRSGTVTWTKHRLG